jgi:hypothetical protein
MADSPDTHKHTTLTQWCRSFIPMLSYEDILTCTVYLPPMFFMVGPAAIVASTPLINLMLNAAVGFAVSGTLHCMGHRLLLALPKDSRAVYLSRSLCLPLRLTLTQFVWLMELLVAAAVFSGIMGKHIFLAGGTHGLLISLLCITAGLGLYFLPVYLGRLWIRRHYPAMPLSGPTEDQVSRSLWFSSASTRSKNPGA